MLGAYKFWACNEELVRGWAPLPVEQLPMKIDLIRLQTRSIFTLVLSFDDLWDFENIKWFLNDWKDPDFAHCPMKICKANLKLWPRSSRMLKCFRSLWYAGYPATNTYISCCGVSKHMKKTVYWGWCVDVCIHLAIPKLQQDPQDLVICQACQTYTLPKTNAALEHLSGPICAYMRFGPPPVHCCFVPHPAEKATGNFILLRIP